MTIPKKLDWVRRDVEAPHRCPHPACASHWRQPSLLAITHVQLLHGQRGIRARTTHRVWSQMSVENEPGPSIRARTRTWAKAKARPRLLCESSGTWTNTKTKIQQRKWESEKRQKIMPNTETTPQTTISWICRGPCPTHHRTKAGPDNTHTMCSICFAWHEVTPRPRLHDKRNQTRAVL